MRKIFGLKMVEFARRDKNIFLISGDVEHEMEVFKKEFPDRYLNAGLCEQSMISMAAGMCSQGLRPYVYSITPFLLERPYEQIKIDIDEHNLPVQLIGYADYPTHGPTHRPLNAEILVKTFKNIKSHFPKNDLETAELMEKYFIKNIPSLLCLKKNPDK